MRPVQTVKKTALALAAFAALAACARACNVPVFRYALERWPSDLYEVIVFHRGPLSDADSATVDAARRLSLPARGPANFDIVLCDVDQPLDARLAEIWQQQSTAAPQFPWVVLRSSAVRGRRHTLSAGTLAEFDVERTIDSPARQELTRRLLSGDSVVWLVLAARGDEQAQATVELLSGELSRLGDELPLPEGLGLPGSELFSPVPLTLRFSVLKIDAADERELSFARFLRTVATSGEGALVAPVFGRGRALDVVPAAAVDEGLIEDISVFLSGACSCQVKEQNPGFDLLLSTNWDRRLFDYDAVLPAAETAATPEAQEVTLVAIPPGAPQTNVHAAPNEGARVATGAGRSEAAAPADDAGMTQQQAYLAAALLGIGALVLLWLLRRSRQTTRVVATPAGPKDPPA